MTNEIVPADHIDKYTEERRAANRQHTQGLEGLERIQSEIEQYKQSLGQGATAPAQPEPPQTPAPLDGSTLATTPEPGPQQVEAAEGGEFVPPPPGGTPAPMQTQLEPSGVDHWQAQQEGTESQYIPAPESGAAVAAQSAMEVANTLLTPLSALGSASLAPMAHDFEAEDTWAQFMEAGEVSIDAFMSALRGEEQPPYGSIIAGNILPENTPDYIRNSVGVAIDVLGDPTVVVGLPFARVVQQGLKQARLSAMAEGKEFKGVVREGLDQILGMGLEIDDEGLSRLGQLAQLADEGDKAAAAELNVLMSGNKAISDAVARLEGIGLEREVDKVTARFGLNKDLPYDRKDWDLSQEGLRKTIHGDTKQSTALHMNLAKLNTTVQLDEMWNMSTEMYKQQYFSAYPSGMSDKFIVQQTIDQNNLLTDLIGKRHNRLPPAEAFAARQILLSSSKKLKYLADQTLKPGATKLEIAAFNKQVQLHRYLETKVTGEINDADTKFAAYDISGASPEEVLDKVKGIVDVVQMDPHVNRVLRQAIKKSDPEAVAKIVAKTRLDKVTDVTFEVFSNAILSGPITHAVNIASNFWNIAWSPTDAVLRTMSAGARLDFQQARLNGGEAIARFQGMILGFQDAMRFLARQGDEGEILEGLGIPKELSGRTDIEKYRNKMAITSEALEATGTVGQFVDYIGKFIRVPGAALVKEDIAFKIMHYRMETGARAVTQAMTGPGTPEDKRRLYNLYRHNPDKTIVDESIDASRYYTFTAELGEIGGKWRKVIDATPGLRWFIPFFNTPTNIAKMGTRHSVVGNMWYDVMKNGDFFKLTPEGDAARARVAVGTVMPAVLLQAMGDNVTGAVDESTPEGRFRAKTKTPPYSIKLPNGEWWSYEKIEPVRSVLGLMVNYRDAINNLKFYHEFGPNAGMPTDAATNLAAITIAPFLKTVGDQYMLNTLTQVVDILDGLSNVAADKDDPRMEVMAQQTVAKLENLAVATLPYSGFLRQANREMFDANMRIAEGAIDKIKQTIPGLSSSLPSRHTIWGDEQLFPDGVGPDFLSPLRTRTIEGDWIDDEVDRLQVNLPAHEPRRVHIQGIPLDLNPEQRARFAILMGKGADGNTPLKSVVEEALILTKGESDIDKRDAVTMIFNDAHTAAKTALFDEDYSLQEQFDLRVAAREKQRRRTQ